MGTLIITSPYSKFGQTRVAMGVTLSPTLRSFTCAQVKCSRLWLKEERQRLRCLYGEMLSAENELDRLSHRYSERSGKACVRQDPEGAEYNLISH